MGRGAGDIALWTGIASGAEQIIIPEVDFDIEKIANKIREGREQGKKHTIIVVAEGVMSGNEFADKLDEIDNFHVRVTVLGHVQRGGSPTARDRVLASRFGSEAVDLLKDDRGGVSLGIENENIVSYNIVDSLNNLEKKLNLDLYKLNEELSY